ncbi:rhamnogalacturonan acetylesterase [Saccharicrinis sp. FJH54]|uniref:rhamnogalacturonan acetylesterase n=1 Tax=Saccharicrinis sp. FJH54 TaxID=3344665 RepID=UPI0035D4B30E
MKKLLARTLLLCVFILGTTYVYGQPESKALLKKFDLGSGKAAKDFVPITPQNVFSKENGLGIAIEYPVKAVVRSRRDKLTGDFLTSDHPFYFNVVVPEGRYKITVTLGDPKGISETTVKAENRRLMLEDIKTKQGEVVTKTFIVDVRTPQIGENEKIRLKKRELGYLNWDDKLTLEFGGPKPCVSSLVIEEITGLPVIFLAGNSTVVDQMYEPWASWGQMFPRFLKPDVVVANYAESGETLKAFRGERRLKKILSVMKPGDYLFMEFAHNDQKPGSSHVEPFTTYQDELRYFMNETRKKGGHPVLVTSTNRRVFDDNGKIVNTLEEYPDAMRQLAKEENVPLIDLNAMSKELFEALGPENSKKAFVHYPAHTYPGQDKPLADNTHFNPYGAYELAKCVVESIKENYPELAKYIVDDFKGFDPKHPDPYTNFFWPVSPAIELVKPDGN